MVRNVVRNLVADAKHYIDMWGPAKGLWCKNLTRCLHTSVYLSGTKATRGVGFENLTSHFPYLSL
jgi:hypothetical protein